MNSFRFAALLLCGLGLLFGCSDDKPSSSSGSSSGSGCKSERDDKDAGNQDKADKPARACGDEDDRPWGDDEDEDEGDKPTDKPVEKPDTKPAESAGAGRGFSDSKQPEGENLDGKELKTDTEMASGRVKVSNLGFSFNVPEGAIAYFATGAAAIQVGEKGGALLTLLIARTGVTQAEARDMISQPLPLGNGVELSPQGEIGGKGDRLTRAMTGAAVTGYVHALIGKSTGVAVITIGQAGTDSECKAYSAKVADSIKFAKPEGEKDRLKYEADLKGKQLHVFKYKSGGGGYGGASWSSETNKYWHLGSDHSYEYFYQHTGASSFDNPDARGGHAADTNNDHQGSWSVELTLTLPVLVLRDSKGEIHTLTLDLIQGRLHIDGDEATVSQSSRKR
ncbi:MAG: hypothetical protein ICCCNLDF_00888 [Planctomycetes bacterium]|nr:hypothetical protein [Planctomycetota bacterium]